MLSATSIPCKQSGSRQANRSALHWPLRHLALEETSKHSQVPTLDCGNCADKSCVMPYTYFSAEGYELTLLMPEDTIVLSTTSAETRSVWLSQLTRCICAVLAKGKRSGKAKHHQEDDNDEPVTTTSNAPPIIRHTSYLFKKNNVGMLKNSEYNGAWVQGKAHGKGTVRWLDGSKMYTGHLKQNLKDGPGKITIHRLT